MSIFKKTDCLWIGQLTFDWPLMRNFIKYNHDKFNKFYYVVNYTTHQINEMPYYTREYYNHHELIKKDLGKYNFEIVYVNTDFSMRDWRDQCFNEFLKNSTAEYIYHLDPDMYVDQQYLDILSNLNKFDFDILCPIWAGRIWPFLFSSRELIDKTTRDFTTKTVRTLINESLYKETKNLKESCYKPNKLDRHGDHGDKLIEELLILTNYSGWKFYQMEQIECIHYAGRTNYHYCLHDIIKNGINKSEFFDLKSRKTILSSQKKTHLDYLNKIKKTEINLFDFYAKECDYFYKNYDNL